MMIEQTLLTNKRIVLGVTGSIAAYKAATIASRLTQAGAEVDVIMTRAATRFVTPITFQSLTGRPVYSDLWDTGSGGGMATHIAHVGLAHEADLLLVAPITANSLAKLALGLSDDLLGVTALAAQCPIVVAPAMDAGMYHNPATQAHVQTLKERGVLFAGPTVGRMASGFEGLGRFLEPDEIVGFCRIALGRARGSLVGRQVVVSAGPTREDLDPVRYLSNRSTGRQGFAIAQAALDAGADVTLIAGPVALDTPIGVKRIDVWSTLDMRDAVIKYAIGDDPTDLLIMAAAVSDFRPATRAEDKIKKTGDSAPELHLDKNPDILLEVSQQSNRPSLTIGFAAESRDLIENAQGKLTRKGLDLIIANDITAGDAGFASETNRGFWVTAQGVEDIPLMSKSELGTRIMAWAGENLSDG